MANERFAAHWRARADEYRRLAENERVPEARRVMDHLARVCADMANALGSPGGERKPLAWISEANVPREANSHRWRIREAEYRAIAEACVSDDGKKGWSALAARCAEMANYLDNV